MYIYDLNLRRKSSEVLLGGSAARRPLRTSRPVAARCFFNKKHGRDYFVFKFSVAGGRGGGT